MTTATASIQIKTVDDRRNKRFGREVRICLRLDVPWHGVRDILRAQGAFAPNSERTFIMELRKRFSQPPENGTDLRVEWSARHRHRTALRCAVAVFWFQTDKPSLTEEEALSLLGGRHAIKRRMRAAVATVLKERHRAAGLAWAFRAADAVVIRVSDAIAARAKDATRYEQRLAALRAEYEAERAAQLRLLLAADEVERTVAKDGLDPRAGRYVRALLETEGASGLSPQGFIEWAEGPEVRK